MQLTVNIKKGTIEIQVEWNHEKKEVKVTIKKT